MLGIGWLGNVVGWDKSVLDFGLWPFVPRRGLTLAVLAAVLPLPGAACPVAEANICEVAKSRTALGTVLIKNARTRVTEWRFARRGDNTGWHRHDHDYVVVPLFDGALELHELGGPSASPSLNTAYPTSISVAWSTT